MTLEEVKSNMNKAVKYKDSTKYKLSACILRKDKSGFFYQAELKDSKANSIVICKLEDIEVLE